MSDQLVRLIVGFSGAGKTIWAAQQARHSSALTAYFDVSGLPTASLTNALARELAARFMTSTSSGSAILPASTGLDALRFVTRKIDLPEPPLVVIDNLQRADNDAICDIISACPNVRFVLLAQPWQGQTELCARLSIETEMIPGWDQDVVAAIFADENVAISPTCARGWVDITAGLPLYVKSAANLSVQFANRDSATFLAKVQKSNHTVELAQEAILKHLIDSLSATEKAVVAALGLSSLRLNQEEAQALIGSLPSPPAKISSVLRSLGRKGLIQNFADSGIRLHDALRLSASTLIENFQKNEILELQTCLRDLFFNAVQKTRGLARLSAWLRLLAPTGRADILADLASNEMFHEVGEPTDLKQGLIAAAGDPESDIELQYWSLDALVFWEMQEDKYVRNPEPYLLRLEKIVSDPVFGARERASVMMKRMLAFGINKDRDGIQSSFDQAMIATEDDKLLSRLLRYNYATALYHSGFFEEALPQAERLYPEYYDLLGIDAMEITGANREALRRIIGPNFSDLQDDLKHLADTLALAAMCKRALNQNPILLGIHAAKFYEQAGAYRSQMTTSQDVADDMLEMGDAEGALQMMDGFVMPMLHHFQFDGKALDVRGQYAIVLAYNGKFKTARSEMLALEPFISELPSEYQVGIRKQRAMIDEIEAGRLQLRSSSLTKQIISRTSPPIKSKKIGRNSLCICGSGIKYKKCCGKFA